MWSGRSMVRLDNSGSDTRQVECGQDFVSDEAPSAACQRSTVYVDYLAVLAMPKRMGSKRESADEGGQVGARLTNRSTHSRFWYPWLLELRDVLVQRWVR